MCEYDGGYTLLTSKWVVTKKAHTCDGCDQTFPAGSSMRYSTGLYEGDFGSGYGCQACIWLANEDRAGTPLHLCWHDLIHLDTEQSHPQEIHRYVQQCLEEGHEPILAVAELIERGFLEDEVMV